MASSLTGSRLGPYAITARLGAGGMGEVWRATDTRLDREVALKVLPEAFNRDPERLARFEREAKLLASLNHPHIAQVHGLEESGELRALVMELVEGPTLDERLAGGALPLDEALDVARQIAAALEAAHARGIVHRDLKPQNVKLGADGKVKVLDFGLAKAMDPATTSSATEPARSPTLMHSPTLTAAGTQLGVILGTAAYMAPEQAKGRPVDKRADVWAFGVLLWEMLTGRRLFEAETVTEVLAAVLRAELPLEALPPSAPPAIRRLLRRCLERDPANRLHDVADARLVIQDVVAGRADEPAPASAAPAPERARGTALAVALAVALGALGFAAGWLLRRPPATAPPAVSSEAIVRKLTFGPGLEAEPSFSPDGNTLVYTTNERGSLDVALLPLGSGEMRMLAASAADEAQPSWSPDGRTIAYSAARDGGRLIPLPNLNTLTPFVQIGGDVFVVPSAGGSPARLVERAGHPTWSPDGSQIAFQSDRDGRWDIYRVPARGGTAVAVTADDVIDFQPAWSPDGRWIAFASHPGLRVAPAEGGEPILLLAAETAVLSPRWAAGGRWLYFSWAHSGTTASLWRLDFAAALAAARRGERSVPERITLGESSDVDVATDRGGRRLAWTQVEYAPDLWSLELETGEMRQLTATSCTEDYPSLAPDGRTLIFQSDCGGGGTGVWALDLRSGARTPVTPAGIRAILPRWSPDGRRLAYLSGAPNEVNLGTLAVRPRDALEELVLARSESGLNGPSWSPDGSRLVFRNSTPAGSGPLTLVDLEGRERALYDPPAELAAMFPVFSADGARVIFQLEGRGEPRHLWSVPVEGGEPRRITDGAREHSHPQTTPARPDEILIVVDHKNVAVVSERTGRVTYLTDFDDSTVVVDYPSWSADGRQILFSLTRRVGDLYLLENPDPAPR